MNAEPLLERSAYADAESSAAYVTGPGPRHDVESPVVLSVSLRAAHQSAKKLFREHLLTGVLLGIIGSMLSILAPACNAIFYIILFATTHGVVAKRSDIDLNMIGRWISLHGVNLIIYVVYQYAMGNIVALLVLFCPPTAALFCAYAMVTIFQLPSIVFLRLNPLSAISHSWRTIRATGVCRSCGMIMFLLLPALLAAVNSLIYLAHLMIFVLVLQIVIPMAWSDIPYLWLLPVADIFLLASSNLVFTIITIVIAVGTFFFNVYGMCLIYSIFCQAHEYMGQPLLNPCVDVGQVAYPDQLGPPIPAGLIAPNYPQAVTTEQLVTGRDLTYSNVGSYGPVYPAATGSVRKSSLEVEEPSGPSTRM